MMASIISFADIKVLLLAGRKEFAKETMLKVKYPQCKQLRAIC
jgi:hypothetical protein